MDVFKEGVHMALLICSLDRNQVMTVIPAKDRAYYNMMMNAFEKVHDGIPLEEITPEKERDIEFLDTVITKCYKERTQLFRILASTGARMVHLPCMKNVVEQFKKDIIGGDKLFENLAKLDKHLNSKRKV